jgi:hypothetical protein
VPHLEQLSQEEVEKSNEGAPHLENHRQIREHPPLILDSWVERGIGLDWLSSTPGVQARPEAKQPSYLVESVGQSDVCQAMPDDTASEEHINALSARNDQLQPDLVQSHTNDNMSDLYITSNSPGVNTIARYGQFGVNQAHSSGVSY